MNVLLIKDDDKFPIILRSAYLHFYIPYYDSHMTCSLHSPPHNGVGILRYARSDTICSSLIGREYRININDVGCLGEFIVAVDDQDDSACMIVGDNRISMERNYETPTRPQHLCGNGFILGNLFHSNEDFGATQRFADNDLHLVFDEDGNVVGRLGRIVANCSWLEGRHCVVRRSTIDELFDVFPDFRKGSLGLDIREMEGKYYLGMVVIGAGEDSVVHVEVYVEIEVV